MRKTLTILALAVISSLSAQDVAEPTFIERTETSSERLTIGGYGQIDYNQALDKDTRYNGKLDVHRLVLLTGYKFSDNTSMVTELEFEHVSEVYVEQAYIKHRLADAFNFKAGLVLIPMGIINELHEPPTFNGVERPTVDNVIVPTTWREIGAGFTGNVKDISLKYQVYVVNGFNGYQGGKATLSGKDGLRKGRQKGAESTISSPNLSAKVDFYRVKGLNLGLAGYWGKTQSEAYHKLDKNNAAAADAADSTSVGIAMVGLDAQYQYKGLRLKGQYIYSALSNTAAYNKKTGADLGSAMTGYYAEAGFDVLSLVDSDKELVPFVRYESYNTQARTEGFDANDAYNRTDIVIGAGYTLAPGAVVKADYQLANSKADDTKQHIINVGVGFWF